MVKQPGLDLVLPIKASFRSCRDVGCSGGGVKRAQHGAKSTRTDFQLFVTVVLGLPGRKAASWDWTNQNGEVSYVALST